MPTAVRFRIRSPCVIVGLQKNSTLSVEYTYPSSGRSASYRGRAAAAGGSDVVPAAAAHAAQGDADRFDVKPLRRGGEAPNLRIGPRRQVEDPLTNAAAGVIVRRGGGLVAKRLAAIGDAGGETLAHEGAEDLVDRLLADAPLLAAQPGVQLQRGGMILRRAQQAEQRQPLARGAKPAVG